MRQREQIAQLRGELDVAVPILRNLERRLIRMHAARHEQIGVHVFGDGVSVLEGRRQPAVAVQIVVNAAYAGYGKRGIIPRAEQGVYAVRFGI